MAVTISRVLHAGYIFDSGKNRIIMDPIFENPFSVNCHAFPNISFDLEQLAEQKFDAIFISHFHDDHFSLESLNRIDRSTPVYFFCLHPHLFDFIRALGFADVNSIQLDRPVQIGDITVTARRALDHDVDSIFHIAIGETNILNVVDSWIDPETLDVLAAHAPWDVVLWPFQTMRELEVLSPATTSHADAIAATVLPYEWLPQLTRLNPKAVVPSSCQFVHESWSWYNHALFPITYAQFEKEVRAILPDSKVQRMNPGTSFRVDPEGLTEVGRLPFVYAIGEQNLDYVYRPHANAPETADISRKLPPLPPTALKVVTDYCLGNLVELFPTLEFDVPTRGWRLGVFDDQGQETQFEYGDTSSVHVWATEIPAYKLHTALTEGEALTSLYLRVFPTSGADILDDPLIRSLFDGSIGSYQLAQLKKLKPASDASSDAPAPAASTTETP